MRYQRQVYYEIGHGVAIRSAAGRIGVGRDRCNTTCKLRAERV